MREERWCKGQGRKDGKEQRADGQREERKPSVAKARPYSVHLSCSSSVPGIALLCTGDTAVNVADMGWSQWLVVVSFRQGRA